MKKQVKFFSSGIHYHSNFVDEEKLSKYFVDNISKNKPYNFVLGQIKKKNPKLLIKYSKTLLKQLF